MTRRHSVLLIVTIALTSAALGCGNEGGAREPAAAPATEPTAAATRAAPATATAGETRQAAPEVPPSLTAQSGSARTSPLATGDAAPMTNVEMRNVDGRALTIDSIRGQKGTLVIFTCNHCPFAKAWHARITALGNRYRAQGVGVIAVNSNDPSEYAEDGFEGMQTLARESQMEFPYVVDATSDVARAYGATKTPEAFLFDKDMKLVYHGAVDDNAQEEGEVTQHYLRDALEAIANDRPVTVHESRALGCGIKFRAAA